MTKSRWMVGAVTVGCLLGVASLPGLAEACQGHMMHGQTQSGHEQDEAGDQAGQYLKHLLKHAKEIGLTPEQIGKVKTMQLDYKRADVRLKADIKVAEFELEALVEGEQTGLSAVQAKVDQLKKAEGAHLIADIKSKRDAMALLTPEQREKDRAHLEHMKSGGQHGGGMGHGGMMGGGGQQHQH